MSAVQKLEPISVEDYLAGELISPLKHEYVDGVVYAMSGATNAHNDIAGNVYHFLRGRLSGGPCRPYNSDTKLRLFEAGKRFYYPDVTVTCRPNPPTDVFQDHPAAVFEVLSRKTRRIDQGEKKTAYLAKSSVLVYALVETESPAVVVHRRVGDEFVREAYEGLTAVLPLPEFNAELPFAEIYENIRFAVERDEPRV